MKVDVQLYKRVFEQQGFSNEEGAVLLLRYQLLKSIKQIIVKKNWTQREAAKILGVKPPRISEIFSEQIGGFSCELLIKYLYRLEKEVSFTVKKKG